MTITRMQLRAHRGRNLLMYSTCLLAGAGLLAATAEKETDRTATSRTTEFIGQPNELPVSLRSVPQFKTIFEPVALYGQQSPQPIGGVDAGVCPSQTFAYTNASFEGGSYVVQGGFGEQGVAAISITLPPEDFPLRIDSTEMVFGTSGATVTTTTEWSLLIWEGNPSTGTLVGEFSSDGVILPHIVIPPGTNGVNVMVMVDPDDPEQIIVQNDGSNTFSFGYRIDKHNNQTSNPCFTAPPNSSNAFPTTDTSGLSAPSNNWISAVNCGTGPFVCVPGGNFITFQDMISLCTPSGDWVMRVNYTPIGCTPEVGACCLPDGTCEILTDFSCDQQNGQFQGANTLCVNVTCPDPIGACCQFDGSSTTCDVLSAADCNAVDGTWLGAGTNCAQNACQTAGGACCIPATGSCVDFTLEDCYFVDGVFQGVNTNCFTTTCFPIGACCLPDGSCADGLSPEDCDLIDGNFQGDGTTCGSVSCPAPTAACCLPNGNCLVLTEANCTAVGGSWTTPGVTCVDSNSSGTADACEDDEPCIGDLNGDGVVNVSDLLILLGAWGQCGDPCDEDLNGDDVVNVSDLLILLGAWGACP